MQLYDVKLQLLLDSNDQNSINMNKRECQDSDEDDSEGTFLSHIEKKMEKAVSICTPKSEQKVIYLII